MPLAVKFISLCLAPLHPPSPLPKLPHPPWVIFFLGGLLISPHSRTTKEGPAGKHPQTTSRALRRHIHVAVIGTSCSWDVVPDWLNYSWCSLPTSNVPLYEFWEIQTLRHFTESVAPAGWFNFKTVPSCLTHTLLAQHAFTVCHSLVSVVSDVRRRL